MLCTVINFILIKLLQGGKSYLRKKKFQRTLLFVIVIIKIGFGMEDIIKRYKRLNKELKENYIYILIWFKSTLMMASLCLSKSDKIARF